MEPITSHRARSARQLIPSLTRIDLQSQSLSRNYGFNLPISFTYILYRLDALDLAADTGTDFQGPRERSGHRRNCGAPLVPNLLEDSKEFKSLYRKENSA